MRSLLPIVAAADNFPAHDGRYPLAHPTTLESYTPFHLCRADYDASLLPIGLLRPLILVELQASLQSSPGSLEAFELVEEGKVSHDGAFVNEVKAVHFAPWVIEGNKMTEVMNALAGRWRDEGKFPGPLGGWRNEHYMIYAPAQSAVKPASSSKPFANAAFTLERAACALFGFTTYGVHMTAYEGEGKDMKIWVPRRSSTKATWPSRLDNSVAGGIAAGMTPMETLVKECDEEASLPEDLVRRCVRSTGAVTYFYITDDGYLQPEFEYTYDLKLPHHDDPSYVRPKPHDDEVESFALLSLPEVIEALHSGDFKPNCGLILVDFLIRHGLVTPEDEPSFFEIVWRTKRRLGFASPA